MSITPDPAEPRRVYRAGANQLPHATIPPADVAHLSGLELIGGWAEGRFPPPPIGKALNFNLVEAEFGRTIFEGEPLRDFYNPIGSVHGSYAAALLDSAMGCAVHTALSAGQGYTTLEYKINLVRGMTDKTGRTRRSPDASDAYTAADIEVLEGLDDKAPSSATGPGKWAQKRAKALKQAKALSSYGGGDVTVLGRV